MEIHNIFLQAHRGFAYLEVLVVAVFLISLLIVMFGYSGKITKLLRKSTLFTMIFFHIQLLVGLVMLFATSGFMNTISEVGMGGLMKNAELRYSYIEHPFSMLIAAILMTIVNKKVKTNEKLPMAAFVIALIALALFVYAIPFAKLFNS